jgi:hypothetical protein
MLALVVLADHLPMPRQISFQGWGTGEDGRSIMSMAFATIERAQAWSRHLGGRTDTYTSATTGRIYLDEGVIRWHGWSVQLHASNDPPLPGNPLDPATTTQVAAVVGGATS